MKVSNLRIRMPKANVVAERALAYSLKPIWLACPSVLINSIKAANHIVQQFNQNFFQLFSLSESFDLDDNSLTEKYHNLQTEVHPDKFAAAEEQERLRAIQMASYLNEAYSTLKSPLARAAYILKLHDFDTESISQNDLGLELLMEQMQLRETLDGLPKDDLALPQLVKLKNEARARLKEKQNSFARRVELGEYAGAKKIFHELQFLEKFLMEIEAAEEQRLGY